MTTTTAAPADRTDIRDVPTVPAVSLVKFPDVSDRPADVRPDVPDVSGRPADVSPDVPDVSETFDNDDPVHSAGHRETSATVPADDRPDTGDVPDRPAPSGRTSRPTARTSRTENPQLAAVSAPDTATSAASAPTTGKNAAMSHATALDGLSKAASVRYVFETLGTPTSAQVEEWLAANGVSIDPAYVRKIVRAERRRAGLAITGDLPALTAEVLAELDHDDDRPDTDETGRDDQDDAEIDHAIDPAPTPAEPPAGYPPAIPADPDAGELAERVRRAQARLPLQSDEALLAALSDEEIAAERALAEWERATDREIRRSAKAAQLANVRREQATAEAIAKSESADARWLQRAVSARRRLISPDAKLAQLHRRSEWSSRALIGVVLLGMVWSGVNVQHNLVPSGDMSDPLYWLSFGIEAMISIPLVVIMLAATTAARWGKDLDRGKVVVFELALLATTIGLNAGPHIGDWSKFAEYAVAPVMVGAVIWLHAWVSARYASLILDGDAALSATHSDAQPSGEH